MTEIKLHSSATKDIFTLYQKKNSLKLFLKQLVHKKRMQCETMRTLLLYYNRCSKYPDKEYQWIQGWAQNKCRSRICQKQSQQVKWIVIFYLYRDKLKESKKSKDETFESRHTNNPIPTYTTFYTTLKKLQEKWH